MVPENLATYTANELEHLAIDDLKRRPDVEHEAPINIEKLIEGLPNVSLELHDGLRAKHRVEGMVLKSSGDDKKLIVLVDSQVYSGPWNAYNATLGEEYAHLRIHQNLQLFVDSVEDFIKLQSDPQWVKRESDARRYSDAIRMPSDLLEAEVQLLYPRLTSDFGFGDNLALYSLIRSRIADRFRVTTTDIQRRMQQPQVGLEDRLLSSLQSRANSLIPGDWEVVAKPQYTQGSLFDVER